MPTQLRQEPGGFVPSQTATHPSSLSERTRRGTPPRRWPDCSSAAEQKYRASSRAGLRPKLIALLLVARRGASLGWPAQSSVPMQTRHWPASEVGDPGDRHARKASAGPASWVRLRRDPPPDALGARLTPAPVGVSVLNDQQHWWVGGRLAGVGPPGELDVVIVASARWGARR